MLLNIYLGTTAISWATLLLHSVAYGKKLEREGYKFIKEKKSISEKIVDLISTAFQWSIPVLNILIAIYMICMPDKSYEIIKNNLLEKGKLYIPTEEMTSSEDEISQNIEETISMIKEATDTSKNYSPDVFIENVYRDMEIVAEMKYEGYKEDLKTLYKQAKKYRKAKKETSTTSPNDVLSPEWFIPLIKIEAKIQESAKIQGDQKAIKASLVEMRAILLREIPDFEEPEEQTETSGNTLTLNL